MKLCDYGCGQKATHQFKNGKWCCSKTTSGCSIYRKRQSDAMTNEKNPMYGKKRIHSEKSRYLKSQSMQGISNPMYGKKSPYRLTIKKIKNQYPIFYKEEKLRYNNTYDIQVHCKNHNCPNSKEKGGWFTPTRIQISERIRQLESVDGNGGSYFYCSEECKNECPLYNLYSDPFKDIEKSYTDIEYDQFRKFVLDRDNYKCQYCGEKAEHVHHERPQKLEPFFSLDPDYAWSVCKKCHYEKGHQDECSTGKLAKIICV